MDFNKRREAPLIVFLANKPELDGPFSHFLNNRTSPEKPV
jgi:hypothetical protein